MRLILQHGLRSNIVLCKDIVHTHYHRGIAYARVRSVLLCSLLVAGNRSVGSFVIARSDLDILIDVCFEALIKQFAEQFAKLKQLRARGA